MTRARDKSTSGRRPTRKGKDRRTARELLPAESDRRESAKDRRTEENLRFVTFHVAEWLLGVRVERVQEVLADRPITAVPLADREMAGLLNLRGQIVTVLDLRARLGLQARPAGAARMSLVIRDGAELYSLLVDSVGEVLDIGASALKEPPPNLDPVWRECCEGVARLPGGGLFAALDVSRVLNSPEPGA